MSQVKVGKLFKIKLEFNDSTTSYNKNIAVELESSEEDVKTLLDHARNFIEEQRKNK
jgi:hypothetical protein